MKINKFTINEHGNKKEIIIDWYFTNDAIEFISERPFRIENGYACSVFYELKQLIEKLKEMMIENGINSEDIVIIDNRK